MYQPYNNYYLLRDNNERYFLAPFLLGGLGGAALVGLSRPRPVYVNPAYPNYNNQPPYYPPRPPYGGYGYYGGNYYY